MQHGEPRQSTNFSRSMHMLTRDLFTGGAAHDGSGGRFQTAAVLRQPPGRLCGALQTLMKKRTCRRCQSWTSGRRHHRPGSERRMVYIVPRRPASGSGPGGRRTSPTTTGPSVTPSRSFTIAEAHDGDVRERRGDRGAGPLCWTPRPPSRVCRSYDVRWICSASRPARCTSGTGEPCLCVR
jgi:hypothetical protein